MQSRDECEDVKCTGYWTALLKIVAKIHIPMKLGQIKEMEVNFLFT